MKLRPGEILYIKGEVLLRVRTGQLTGIFTTRDLILVDYMYNGGTSTVCVPLGECNSLHIFLELELEVMIQVCYYSYYRLEMLF